MAANPKFHTLIKQMYEMHDKKNNDYASSGNPYSNFEQAAAFAGCSVDTVFAVLIGIKEARLRELTASGKTPNNESIQDTRLDAAVYTALRASYFLPNEGKAEKGINLRTLKMDQYAPTNLDFYIKQTDTPTTTESVKSVGQAQPQQVPVREYAYRPSPDPTLSPTPKE